MTHERIFIDQDPQRSDFIMRMPASAMPAFYEMLQAAPLIARRFFDETKRHIEQNYSHLTRHNYDRKEAIDALL